MSLEPRRHTLPIKNSWAKSGEHSLVFYDWGDVDSTTITRWANKLKKSGLKGLVNAPKHLDGIIVKSEHRQQVQKWLKSDPNITIGRVKIKLEERFGIKVSPATAHNIMRAVGFSHITARSVHYKQDMEKLEEFKKNSNRNKRKKSR